jgi:endoglucanase
MAHHKMHDESWAPMPMIPPTDVDNDNENVKQGVGRYLYSPSTAATLNLAAVGAQCARIWKDKDSGFSASCLNAAEKAWRAAVAHPDIYAGNAPGNGGGNYDDNNVSDEFYWAAAELYITTGKEEYKAYLLKSSEFGKVEAFDWGHTAPLGSISLVTVKNDLPKDKLEVLKHNFNTYAANMSALLQKGGYPALIEGDYPWGSNGTMLNNMILLGVAYQLSGDQDTLNTMRLGMDYILGSNTLNKSFISGYGTYPMLHPHHRFWANDPSNGYPPPPPGAVSGGVNFAPSDNAALKANLAELPPAKRYQDELAAFSTNEVAINWNAPLVWVSAFLDSTGK